MQQEHDDFDSDGGLGASIWLVGAALMTVALMCVWVVMGGGA